MIAAGMLQLHASVLRLQEVKNISDLSEAQGGGGGPLLVAQLVDAMHYKPEGRGFDSRWCHWNFSLT
jgi:hypothetical protein